MQKATNLLSNILTIAFICLSFSLFPNILSAADSCPKASTLQECAVMNIKTCRDDAGCSGDRQQALTSTDVTDSVTDKCCDKSGKKAKRCVKRERRKAGRAASQAPAAVKPFMRQLKSDISKINCSTNTSSSF